MNHGGLIGGELASSSHISQRRSELLPTKFSASPFEISLPCIRSISQAAFNGTQCLIVLPFKISCSRQNDVCHTICGIKRNGLLGGGEGRICLPVEKAKNSRHRKGFRIVRPNR